MPHRLRHRLRAGRSGTPVSQPLPVWPSCFSEGSKPMSAFIQRVSSEEDRTIYAASTPRAVIVPDAALVLFRRVGLTPPEAGPYTDMVALNAKLSGLTIAERMEAK